MYDEKYCTNRWRLKYNSAASPIQTIMFDNGGNCVGGYELCYGNAKMLDGTYITTQFLRLLSLKIIWNC